MDYFSRISRVSLRSRNKNCENVMATGLRARHTTYSRKLKPQTFRVASFFHDFAKISTCTITGEKDTAMNTFICWYPQELLVEWMRASSAELMGRVQSIQTYLEDLDAVCTRALAASQHPAVTFEVRTFWSLPAQ